MYTSERYRIERRLVEGGRWGRYPADALERTSPLAIAQAHVHNKETSA